MTQSAEKHIVEKALDAHRQWQKNNGYDELAKLNPQPEQSILTIFKPLTVDTNHSDRQKAMTWRLLLLWLVDSLKPEEGDGFTYIDWDIDDGRWLDPRWREFHSIYHNYMAPTSLTLETVAQQVAIEDIYPTRNNAIERLIERYDLAEADPDKEEFNILVWWANGHYRQLDQNIQAVLTRLALYPNGVTLERATQFFKRGGVDHIDSPLNHLVKLNLLNMRHGKLKVPKYVALAHGQNVPITQLHRWRLEAAEHLEQHEQYHAALELWIQTSEVSRAIDILFQQVQQTADPAIIDSQQLDQLIAKINDDGLTKEQRGKLHIVQGQLTERTKDLETALGFYEQAISCQDIYLQTLAQSFAGNASKKTKRSELAAMYYEEGIKDGEEYAGQNRSWADLLFDLCIDATWLFMQEGGDIQKAQQYKLKADKLLTDHDYNHDRKSKHSEATAYLAKLLQPDSEELLNHLLQALRFAELADDHVRIMKVCQNIGQWYAFKNQPDTGLDYINRALPIANQLGDQQMEASCLRLKGVCYYFKHQQSQAQMFDYYNQALMLFQETKNPSWESLTRHDLAEAYAETGDRSQASNHYEKAKQLANKHNVQDAKAMLNELATRFSWLDPTALIVDDKHLKKLEGKPKLQELYRFVQDNEPVQVQDIATGLGRPRDTASKQIRQLLNEYKIVRKEGERKGTKYYIKTVSKSSESKDTDTN